MSAPGSAARLALFRLTGTHCCCSTWGGLVFILVFRQECAPLQRCTLRLSVLWHNSIGSLFLSTCTTTWQSLFGFLPVPCVHCCGFRDYGTPQRSTHVCNRILQASSTSANNPFRPDTLIFLTGERIGVFFGAFCALLLSWYLLTVWFRP